MLNPYADGLVFPERAPTDSRDYHDPENLKIPALGHNHNIPLVTEKSKCLFEGKYLPKLETFLERERQGVFWAPAPEQLGPRPLADVYIQALDLLVECREGNAQRLGRSCLAPIRCLQLFDNRAALEIRDNLKQ